MDSWGGCKWWSMRDSFPWCWDGTYGQFSLSNWDGDNHVIDVLRDCLCVCFYELKQGIWAVWMMKEYVFKILGLNWWRPLTLLCPLRTRSRPLVINRRFVDGTSHLSSCTFQKMVSFWSKLWFPNYFCITRTMKGLIFLGSGKNLGSIICIFIMKVWFHQDVKITFVDSFLLCL